MFSEATGITPGCGDGQGVFFYGGLQAAGVS